MAKLYVGTITIVIDTPKGRHPTDREAAQVATDAAMKLKAALLSVPAALGKDPYPFDIEFELLSTSFGCIKAKFAAFIVGSLTVLGHVAKYHDLRESIVALWNDGRIAATCVFEPESRECTVRVHTAELSKQLHKVVEGETLSQIVAEKWRVPKEHRSRAMAAVLKHYPSAFAGGDINKLMAGYVIGLPTEAMSR